MTDSPLYILTADNIPVPATLSQYDAWEEAIPREDRCALGKRLAQDTSDGLTVVTMFLACAVGYYGRKPQVFVSLAVGVGVWETSCYTSYRAAMAGHPAMLTRLQRKTAPSIKIAETA